MNQKRRELLYILKKGINKINIILENLNETEIEIEETTYYRRPDGTNEYAIIGVDNGHNDIADRIFKQEGYQVILNNIENKTGKKIEKWRFLLYAGYILVDEGGIKRLPYRYGQKELNELLFCSYSLSENNKVFVREKIDLWEKCDPIIIDLYGSKLPEKSKADIRKMVELVKSEIEKMQSKEDQRE